MKYFRWYKQTYSLSLYILFSFSVYGQNTFNAGIDVGVTSSQISGDSFYGFGQFGLTGAVFTNVSWNDDWSTTLQFAWNPKGARKYLSASNSVSYKLRVNYIDIPIWMEYKYETWMFFAGPSVNVHINHRELINNTDAFPERPFKSIEYAISGGVSYFFNERILLRGIFNNSVLPVRNHLNQNSYPNPKFAVGNFHRSILNKGQYFTSITLKISYFFRQY